MSQSFAFPCVCAVLALGVPRMATASVVDPLLVVVETSSGAGVGPAEVRRAIAGELGAEVRAPRDPAAPDTADLLIVTVNQAEIRMSLRTRASGVVSRAVPAPGERKARLASIGWLAGNLAREQVSAIIAAEPEPASVSTASTEGEPAASVASASVASPPPLEPPPLPEISPRGVAPTSAAEMASASEGILSARSLAVAETAVTSWSFTLAGGPTALFVSPRDAASDQSVWPGPGVYSLEVQRRPSAAGSFLGAALEVAPDLGLSAGTGADLIALTALGGVGHRFGRTFVEGTVGFGLEAYQWTTSATMLSPRGLSSTSEGAAVRLGLHLRGQATAGVLLSTSFDLVASLGGHLGTVGKWDHFVTSALGVRFRLR